MLATAHDGDVRVWDPRVCFYFLPFNSLFSNIVIISYLFYGMVIVCVTP